MCNNVNRQQEQGRLQYPNATWMTHTPPFCLPVIQQPLLFCHSVTKRQSVKERTVCVAKNSPVSRVLLHGLDGVHCESGRFVSEL